jgi:hypothetical protein
MIYDGCRVRYTGMDDGALVLNDQGSVLVVSGRCAHVQWKTGARAGEVSMVDTVDLDPLGSRQGSVEEALDDSLEVSGLGPFTARQIYDEGGCEALLNAMADSGRLASFTEIAEEALALVAGRIRISPPFQTLSSHLDEDETDRVVRLASAVLIRDAFHAS